MFNSTHLRAAVLAVTLLVFGLLSLGGNVKAQTNESTSSAVTAPVQIFDSSNHYLGGCSLTNEGIWTLDQDLYVTTFQIWYNWNAGEKEIGFTITKDGQPFAEGRAVRSECDPYQSQWCNGDYLINRIFPRGSYTVKVATSRQCLVPGGTGVVRLYGPSPATAGPLEEAKPSVTPPAESVPPVTTVPVAKCSCPNSWCLPVFGVSALLNLVLLILIARKK